jgi:hypothetical protein
MWRSLRDRWLERRAEAWRHIRYSARKDSTGSTVATRREGR